MKRLSAINFAVAAATLIGGTFGGIGVQSPSSYPAKPRRKDVLTYYEPKLTKRQKRRLRGKNKEKP